LVVLALSFVACDVEPEPDQAPQAVAQHHNPFTAPDGDRFENVESDLTGDAPGTIPDDPCECLSDACLEQWANANLGCSVCVTLVCPGITHHACTTCEPPHPAPHPQ